MSKYAYAKRCRVCLDTLLTNGSCRWHCDPELAAPARRQAQIVKQARERMEDPRISIAPQELRNAFQHAVPSYATERAVAAARAKRGARQHLR